MRAWIELLPLFIVRRLALRHCERLPIGGMSVVQPRPGTMFKAQQPVSRTDSEGAAT